MSRETPLLDPHAKIATLIEDYDDNPAKKAHNDFTARSDIIGHNKDIHRLLMDPSDLALSYTA